MEMKVGKLRELLEEVLESLEDYDDNEELTLQGNTFFTRDNTYVLQTPQGFLGLDNVENAIHIDETEGGDDE